MGFGEGLNGKKFAHLNLGELVKIQICIFELDLIIPVIIFHQHSLAIMLLPSRLLSFRLFVFNQEEFFVCWIRPLFSSFRL